MYPLNKYKYYFKPSANGHPRQVIAVSTYAGRTVRGVATCHENDEYDVEKGKKIAALRCAKKVAEKRAARAHRKCNEALDALEKASVYYDRMIAYYDDAFEEIAAVDKELEDALADA